MKESHTWMDEQETYYIRFFGTYTTGLNFTRGGQHGCNSAAMEARYKIRDEIWRERYMPVFRGSSYGRHGRLWATPPKYTESDVEIGRILREVRKGLRTIPPSCTSEMKLLGFDKDKSNVESKWENDYMPLFRGSSYGRQGRLWEMPATYSVSSVKLGSLLTRARLVSTSIPPMFVSEMKLLGFDRDKSFKESRFKSDDLHIFYGCYFGVNRCLWATPLNYTYQGFKVGRILRDIRVSDNINDADLAELNHIGFDHKMPSYSDETGEIIPYSSYDREDRDELEGAVLESSSRSPKRARLA
jgi:hypothetical protein